MTLAATPASGAEAQLEVLETKVRQLLARSRKSREAVDTENARLRQELAEAERERGEVRRRIERLVKQIDSLSGE